MKRSIFYLCLLSFLSATAIAQNAKVGSVEVNKIQQPCVMAEYNYAADIVEGALKKKFGDLKLGSGDKTRDGFRLFKGVTIPDIAREKMDVYYKIEDRKPSTVVYMLTSKGYDNFTKLETDSQIVNNTIRFLDGFTRDINVYQLNKEISEQEKVIADLDKKLRSAIKDGESLQDKKAKTENDIREHTTEVSALKTEMEHQQRSLELARTKTATIDQMKDLKKEVNKQEKASSKATKRYENAVEDNANRKQSLAETERAINDNLTEQGKLKAEQEAANAKLQDLKRQLSELR